MTLYVVYSLARVGAPVPYHVGITPANKAFEIHSRAQIVFHSSHADKTMAQAACEQLSRNVRHVPLRRHYYQRGPILCVTNDTTYRSATEAAIVLGISNSSISYHLNNPERHPTARGYVFKRLSP